MSFAREDVDGYAMFSECQVQGMQRWLFFGRQMVREKEEGQKRHGVGQWQEKLRIGVGLESSWRLRPRTGRSGGQCLRHYVPMGTMSFK